MLLKGLRVLDLSTLLPGPMCSLFLADLGADVIKIEGPKGDLMRSFELNNNKSPYFDALNRNKRSIMLDLKTNEGKKKFMLLAKKSEVIIEGFRPGKMDALGIGYKDIKKVNSKIVYCSITGYGQKGAFRNKAGHDLNYSSLSGLLDVMSNKPFVPGVQVADVGCALIAAFSILAALIHREKHKEGNYIDASIFSSALALISIHIAQNSTSKKSKTVLSGTKPCYNVYETKDGKYLSLGAIEKKFWESFCNSIKRKDWISKQFDEDFTEDLRLIFKSRIRDEWLNLNEKYDFCCEPIRKIDEIVNNKYLNKNKIIISLDGIKQVSFPAIFSSIETLNYAKAPKLGQHTEEVLSRLAKKVKRN